jgi:hypothetical protein
MNSQTGFRGARVRSQWWAIAAGAAALVVITISTVLCARPATAASDVASVSSVNVKYFVVPRPVKMPAESLYEIAMHTLGDGARYPQIFALNKGRLQPGGGRLENPRVIEPGWILCLPADAVGPGVHFGPLPAVTAKTASRHVASPPLSASALPVAMPSPMPTGKAGASDSLAPLVIVGGIVLFVAIVAAWVFSADRRRTVRRRGGSHARATTTLIAGDPWMGSPDLYRSRAESRVPDGDYPSWPGRPGPYALHPDHPSWPGRPDPRWAATEAFLRTSDFHGWPDRQASPATIRPVSEPTVKPDSAYIHHEPGRHRVPARYRP